MYLFYILGTQFLFNRIQPQIGNSVYKHEIKIPSDWVILDIFINGFDNYCSKLKVSKTTQVWVNFIFLLHKLGEAFERWFLLYVRQNVRWLKYRTYWRSLWCSAILASSSTLWLEMNRNSEIYPAEWRRGS